MSAFRPLCGTLLTVFLLCGASVLAQVNGTPKRTFNAALEEEVKQLERDRQAAFVRHEVDAIENRTAEDYTTINASGQLSTKQGMMQNLRRGARRVISNSLSDLKARIYGDSAVLTGTLDEVSETARSVGLTEEDIGDAYHNALSWARAIETTTAAA